MRVQGSISMTEQMPNHAIAIVGMAGRFPRARNLEEFWHIISNGVEVLDTASDGEMDAAGVGTDRRSNSNFVPKYTTLAEADYFDAGFFGMSPREAQILDPQQRIFLECAWEALENAGYSSNSLEQSVGVYAGASMNTYIFSQLLRNPAFVAAVGGYQLMLGNDKDFLCTHVSYELNLRGPSLTIQTACSTSLVAVAMACQALHAGECDMALAGGVSVTFPQRSGYMYEEGMILSPDGHCRPFDIDAHGTRAGAGAGIVVLKRLSDALADRDTIHAVIRGVAINNDGAGKAGYTAPSIDGQAEVVATAQALAGIAPRTISYIEAHGTGTHLGDPIEIAALTKVFRASTADVGFCRLGSLKANIGHLDAAAGVAGLIKTVLALKHREIPPLVNFRTPNPQIDLARSPFIASAEPSSWASDGTPRRAGVSSFGIGGTNAHVVVEEAPPSAPASSSGEPRLLVVSAKSAAALDRATTQLADFLDQNQGQSLADAAWTLQAGRQAFTHRRAIVAKNETQAIELLRAPVLTAQHEGGVRPVAFMFSGQGSQYAGMAAGLYEAHPVFRDAIDSCAQVLEPLLKLDIRQQILSERNDPLINETRFAQPALLTVEYALASLWRSWGVTPQAMLGHSIGEYAAAHLAGVMSLEDALLIVAARGRLMQDLPAGSMAAVHCAAEELRKLACEGIEIAAINAPGLCTVSGPTAAVAELLKRLEAKKIEFRPLHTSHAFHSAMMEPALEPFAKIVKHIELRPPQIPYISNVTGTWITAEQATSPDYYTTHLRRPVQFEAGIRTIATEPGILLLEVGPGNALSSLARLTVDRQKGKHIVSSLSHPQEHRPDGESILEAAGRLWITGVDIEWSNLHPGTAARRVPLPTYPFERKRYWVEATPAASASTESGAVSFSEDVGDWLFAPTWTRQPLRTGASPKVGGVWLLLGQRGELGQAVEQRLRAGGANVILVEDGERFEAVGATHFRARWDQVQDLSAIVERIAQADGPVAGAIFLGTGSLHDRSAGRAAYDVLVALAEALPANGRPVRTIVARFGTESVLNETVLDPEAALALGPILVLPTEVPHLQMRAVDLEMPDGAASVDAAAAAIVEEVADDGLENVVAWRGTCRWMRRFERIPTTAANARELPLKTGGVYLITGGLGGLGLTLAHWLAAQASARLVLTARTPLPPREQWDRWVTEKGPTDLTTAIIKKIRDIEESGGEVVALVADAGDIGQMKQVIKAVRDRFGALDGVIHAAGVPGTGRISFLKEPDDIQAVLAPKLGGLDVLVRLLGDTPLDLVVLISTINSVLGAPGLSDYAGANAVLDAFPNSARRPASWKHVVSIDWGPWRDVGMAAKLFQSNPKTDLQQYRRATIPPQSGADAFARALASRNTRVVVVPFNLAQHVEQLRRPSEQAVAEKSSIASATETSIQAEPERPEVTTTCVPPSTNVERQLVEIWSALLGVDRIGIDDNFFELGGHSLLATRVLARVRDQLQVQLTLRNIFDASTVRSLAAEISRLVPDDTAKVSEEREEIVF
jgi:acyl transferase domain-containing protein